MCPLMGGFIRSDMLRHTPVSVRGTSERSNFNQIGLEIHLINVYGNTSYSK